MSDDDTEAKVLVFRNPAGEPVAVPEGIVEENDRTYRSYQLHLQGASWKSIALQEGYLDARAAQSDVNRYMAEARALLAAHTRQERLQTELSRLDALQGAVWQQAMRGHLPAAKMVMDLIITRVKIQGLDLPSKEDEGPARTVIIPLSDEEYISSLQALDADSTT